MPPKRISADAGVPAVRAALAGIDSGDPAPRDTVATAVRYLLQVLADRAEGNTVEVRVPPFGAVQAIQGPRHTRGTPPNVVEMDAGTWLSLATGGLDWAAAVASARVSVSGTRADLSEHLPLAFEG
jgi:hypothetical protein